MEKKHLLKTGEFARLCRTTKETLLHYDRKGLLKPRHVAANGYRWYGAEQFFQFDLISLLKEAGCSLEEILRSRAIRERHGYAEFLRERIVLLEKEQQRLAHRLSMLDGLAAMAKEVTTRGFDTLFFENRNSEQVLFYPVDPDKMTDLRSLAECYSLCLRDSLLHENTVDVPLGSVIPKEHAARKDFRHCYLFRHISEKDDGDIRRTPSGNYACLLHEGDTESHMAAFRLLLDTVTKRKWRITSDVYIYDQMSYLLSDLDSETYIAKYAVRIDPQEPHHALPMTSRMASR